MFRITSTRATVAAAVCGALCSSVSAASATKAYNLPAGDAATTLKQFAAHSGTQIVYLIENVRGEKTNAVVGEFSARQALERMLAGTALVVFQDEPTGALVVARSRGAKRVVDGTGKTPGDSENAKRKSEQRSNPLTRGVALLAALFTAPTLELQAAAAETAEKVQLSPFEVSTSKDTGYVAGSSLAGGRAETPLKLTPASISVMTREFMDDLNILSLEQAVHWTVSAMPGNERQNESAFATFEYNFRNTGGTQNYPTRNYFLFYANSDTYNTERFEFSRGPNSLLFGDAALGGVSTNFTKQARFNLKRHELRFQADSFGGWRTQFDSQVGVDRFAVRVNGIVQRHEGWRDATFQDRDGFHVAASYKVNATTQLRAEHETLTWNSLLHQTTYADQASFWNRRTVNESNAAIAGASALGLETFGSAPYLVFSPATPDAGVLDWRTSYRTRGTGFALSPDGRPHIANFPRLPRREINLGPVDAEGQRELNYHALYIDQRITADWFAQLAYFRMDHDAETRNTGVRASEYRIDVNRLLPNGQHNPKFGVPFADVDQNIEYHDNRVEDVRLLTTYKFDVSRLADLKQRFSVIGGYRPERFEMWQRRMRRVNNPAEPRVNNDANRVRYRLYWDEPARYGVGSRGPSIPGAEFRYVDSGFGSKEHKDLAYAQIVSASTFLNDRVSVIAGTRRDSLERRIIQQIGNDPVTGHTVYGGYDPAIRANRAGHVQREHVSVTSGNLGVVAYLLPWFALQANFSENFGLPTTGVNKYNGAGFAPTRGKGRDFGAKFSLAQNKLYAVVSRYETEQVERIIGGSNLTEIRRIWSNAGAADDAHVNFNYRDTEDIEAKGWEAEIVANPTRTLRLTANYARPASSIIEQRPGLRAYVAQHRQEWAAAGNNPALANAAQIRADIAAIENTLEGIARGATNNFTFKDSVNFYGTYAFTEGPLCGFSIGGGGNYRGERKIGSRDARLKFGTTTPTATQIRAAAFDYLYAPATFVATMHASYEYRVSPKLRTRLQLNVSNLLDNDELVITNFGTYSVRGIAGNPLMQTESSFYYLEPRKITLSLTLQF